MVAPSRIPAASDPDLMLNRPANLSANLSANFSSANIHGSNFSGVNEFDAKISGAKLTAN
jgi:hypothetical protein